MRWLGKVLGGTFGFLIGGPLGAVLGTALGYQFDKGLAGIGHTVRPSIRRGHRQRVQMVFFSATFSVMGHVAKADGRVSRAEIELAESVMANMVLSEKMRREAKRLFNEGKSAAFPLNDVLDRLLRESRGTTVLLRMFIEIQLRAALADGALHPSEEHLLLHICRRLKFSRLEYEGLKRLNLAQRRFSGARARSRAKQQAHAAARRRSGLDDAYAILGVTSASSDTEITRAYRRLLSQNHPDKLAAKGLPEEMMKIANEKTQQIRRAYELIRSSRTTRR